MLKQSHRLPQRPSPALQVSLIPIRSQPPTVPLPAESILKWGCFLVASEGKLMNKQAEENKGAAEGFTNNKFSKPRRFAGEMCIYARSIIEDVSEQK